MSSEQIEREMELVAEVGSPSSSRIPIPNRSVTEEYFTVCIPLYQAALKGNWEAAKVILEGHPWVVLSGITKENDTALHIAAAAGHVTFVEKLVQMSPDMLELRNNRGDTALFYAVMSGNLRIVKLMINQNEKLPMIRGNGGVTPLYMAASLGHSDLVWYLYHKTTLGELDIFSDGIGILSKCISSDLFDVALHMVKPYPVLALIRNKNEEMPLDVLARKTSILGGASHCGLTCVKVRDQKLKQIQALQLVNLIWKEISKLDEEEISRLTKKTSGSSQTGFLFVAAELGNTKFLIELIRSYPDLIWKVDDQNRTIFHVAVLHRRESIFNLIHEIGSIKEVLISYLDSYGNNILHLAGELAPPDQLRVVPGAALQMQRELLWFKAVEKIVQPSFIEWKNKANKTPRELFSNNHKDLLKDGEKWMKNTASQSMLVATLIATVMFAAAFTVPGGNQGDSGTPLFLRNSFFMVFIISDAISLVTSSTSILTFLSILTSGFSENDFLESLPSKLVIGFLTLFVSIITMMVAFSANFFLVYVKEFIWVPITVAIFCFVPIIFFVISQRRLLAYSADIIRSTYKSWSLFKAKPMLY